MREQLFIKSLKYRAFGKIKFVSLFTLELQRTHKVGKEMEDEGKKMGYFCREQSVDCVANDF